MYNKLFFSIISFILIATISIGQPIKKGPELDNDDAYVLNRILGDDENNFYTAKLRTYGLGTSILIEKYNKSSLNIEFTKEIELENDKKNKIVAIEYSQKNIFVFSTIYEKTKNAMELYCKTISEEGTITSSKVEIPTNISDHYEYINYEIYYTPNKEHFLIKVVHRPNAQTKFQTDLFYMDSKTMKSIWKKSINRAIAGPIIEMLADFGLKKFLIDNYGNIFYVSNSLEWSITSIKFDSNIPSDIKLPIENGINIGFGLSANGRVWSTDAITEEAGKPKAIDLYLSPYNELIVTGFVNKRIEQKGQDKYDVGIINFIIDLSDFSIILQKMQMFDDTFTKKIEAFGSSSKYCKYKIDHIIQVKKSTYIIGQQYNITKGGIESQQDINGSPTYNNNKTPRNNLWSVQYKDIILAKINYKGEFEWIKNIPLRNGLTITSPSIFEQYICVNDENSIQFLYNEDSRNAEMRKDSTSKPEDLKYVSKNLKGSNFVMTSFNLDNNSFKHQIIFENDNFCYSPLKEINYNFMPSSKNENFVRGKNNNIIFYTKKNNKSQIVELETN